MRLLVESEMRPAGGIAGAGFDEFRWPRPVRPGDELRLESEMRPVGGIIGAGFDEFRWPRPVRPGDELRLESEVLEVRPSKSRPKQGLIKVKTTTLNQDGAAVQVLIANLLVPRRPAG